MVAETEDAEARRVGWGSRLLAIVVGLFALAQTYLGARLAIIGGSPYFVVAGVVMLVAAVLLWRGRRSARLLFHLLLAGTVIWAWWETGGEFWGMLARVGFLLFLWLLVLLATRGPRRAAPLGTAPKRAAVAAGIALVAIGGISAERLFAQQEPPAPVVTAAASGDDWTTYSHTLDAQRFSPLQQINATNAGKLELAWSYRTGDMPRESDKLKEFVFEATPLKIGDNLYLCTPHNIVISLDAETGRERWRFDPHVQDQNSFIKACRGVAYYKADASAGTTAADCPERIIAGTIDGRMLALDTRTGRPCAGFGTNGQINAIAGMENPPPGFAYITSAPFVIGRVAIVGGWVNDGFSTGEPSGAVRAFDVMTGQLVWAWDAGQTYTGPLAPGQFFTPGTPNSWAPMSADPALGLVYLPTGNATPDYWGAHRSPRLERFASSIVALEAATGKLRWTYQTVHHDVWDYDVPAAPVLFDLKRGGQTFPALAQVTKSGQIFVLDRRTGRPLTPVVERPVPQNPPPGEWLSPTQPISTVPSIAGDRLTEASMWGLTPIDQLMCRIMFRTYRYDGLYTPQSIKGTISYPAPYGATDWGGATYDPARGLLIVNSSLAPMVTMLVPREAADEVTSQAVAAGHDPSSAGISPQRGTPFGMTGFPMLSPLAIPCIAPPWGYLTAIDLANNRVAWKVPLGTGRDSGPLGMKAGLPFKVGVFSMGGATTTRGGVTFIAATLDNYIRALNTRTGEVLWRARLPAGGQATPMTYRTRSGRQMVVVSAGGHGALMTRHGDYVMAYALPR